jgi:hypothetical protein
MAEASFRKSNRNAVEPPWNHGRFFRRLATSSILGLSKTSTPIFGKLLGHTQSSTTMRYVHLDNDPLRRASESIAGRIAVALDGKSADLVNVSAVAGARRLKG